MADEEQEKEVPTVDEEEPVTAESRLDKLEAAFEKLKAKLARHGIIADEE